MDFPEIVVALVLVVVIYKGVYKYVESKLKSKGTENERSKP